MNNKHQSTGVMTPPRRYMIIHRLVAQWINETGGSNVSVWVETASQSATLWMWRKKARNLTVVTTLFFAFTFDGEENG